MKPDIKKPLKWQWPSSLVRKACSPLQTGIPFVISLLPVCLANAALGQEPVDVGNGNFSHLLRNDMKGLYRLVEDIDLGQPENGTLRSPWETVGKHNNPFEGTLDGDGHIIYGLNVTTKGNGEPAGLFGFMRGAKVRHLMFVRPWVLSTGEGSPAGAVVGEMEHSEISQSINYLGQVETNGSRSYLDNNYSAAGGLAGWIKDDSRLEDSLNTGAVSTKGNHIGAGGGVGYALKSTVSNNLNTGAVSVKGDNVEVGGVVGFASNSTVSNNLNTGAVSINNGTLIYAGGVVGRADSSSTVSNNLNTGAVSTKVGYAYTGGVVGKADSSFTVSNNLNTGAVSTKAGSVGGVAGEAHYSTVSNNLNTGAVSKLNTGVVSAKAGSVGGVAGVAYASTVSNNLNTGAVSTKGGSVGGVVGKADSSFTVSNNLNTGAVSIDDGSAGGAVGVVGEAASFSSSFTVSNNLNTGNVTVGSGTRNDEGILDVSLETLRQGLNYNDTGLNDTLWRAGGDDELPMLTVINAAYRDLQRINDTQNNNRFPAELDLFADPGGSMDASLFDQETWYTRGGYLPFPKGFSQGKIESVGGGFAFYDYYCLFDPLSGVIERLLFDGEQYQALVNSTGLSYRAAYEQDGSLVSLEPCCHVHSFQELNDNGVVVDAITRDGGSYYIAWHKKDSDPSDPNASFLARYLDFYSGLELDDGDDRIEIPTRPMDMFVYNYSLYLVGSDAIQKEDGTSVFSVEEGETILSAKILCETLYLLLKVDGGLRVRATSLNDLNEEPISEFIFVPVGNSKVAGLQASNGRIHLLFEDNGQIHWLKYHLNGEKDSEYRAELPASVDLKRLDLIQEQVIAMGSLFQCEQPWWSLVTGFEEILPTTVTTAPSPVTIDSHSPIDSPIDSSIDSPIDSSATVAPMLTTLGIMGLIYSGLLP
ncbi:MAG: hypothetical protein ACR2PX_28480 [Endozoicomonas sp.]|uniref:hypothetical protein n=1 Tax=Endozoicomonas sp. TaxID=1892382 RepID=UPI003D9AC622